MRVVLILAVGVILMVFFGWVSFNRTDGTASVTIDTDAVKQDTADAAEKSKELIETSIDKARDAVRPEEKDASPVLAPGRSDEVEIPVQN